MSAEETGEEVAQDLEEADDDVTRTQRWYAYAYLTVLFSAIVLSLGAAIHLGIISPDIEISAAVSVGWIVEYIVLGIGALFILFTAAMVLVALPVSIMQALARAGGRLVDVVARVADSYELPQDDTVSSGGDGNSEDEDG